MRNGFLCLFATLVAVAPVFAQSDKPAPPSPVEPAAGSPYGLRYAAAVPAVLGVDAPAGTATVASPPAGLAAPCGDAMGGGGGLCPAERVWARAEYLMWWMRGASIPPLVTTGPAVGAFPGAIGPGTAILFGGSQVNTNFFNGGRFSAGVWLGECHEWGLEGSYMFLGPQTTNFTATSTGTPLLARPFTTPAGVAGSELIAVPAGVFQNFIGGVAGSISAGVTTNMDGAEANVVRNLLCGCNGRLEVFGGFRYLHLRDRLRVDETLTVGASATPLANSAIAVTDRFNTDNYFYGGQLGIRGELRFDRLFLNASAKVALGDSHQVVVIGGATTITPAGGAAVTLPGGLLALPTNSGTYIHDQFGVIPEVNVNVGYQVTNAARVFVGYSFLSWNRVVRAGDQIDLVVNPFFVPTNLNLNAAPLPLRPQFSFHERTFWAQGLNFGLELRF